MLPAVDFFCAAVTAGERAVSGLAMKSFCYVMCVVACFAIPPLGWATRSTTQEKQNVTFKTDK